MAVAREEDRGGGGLAAGARNGEVVEVVCVDGLEADERFTRSRDAGEEDQPPCRGLCRLVNDLSYRLERRRRRRPSPVDGADGAAAHQFAGRLDDRRERAVGIRRQEAGRVYWF